MNNEDTEFFAAEIGRVFRTEWQRARRRALAIAFAVGMLSGLLFDRFRDELAHLYPLGGEMTNQSLIDPSRFRPGVRR